MDEKYEDLGEVPINGADDANIPVDIWLKKLKEDESEGDRVHVGMWRLTANNYMPRKGCLSGEGAYKAFSEDRQVLVDLVHRHWLHLYQTAVKILMGLKQDDDGTACLYYWEETK